MNAARCRHDAIDDRLTASIAPSTAKDGGKSARDGLNCAVAATAGGLRVGEGASSFMAATLPAAAAATTTTASGCRWCAKTVSVAPTTAIAVLGESAMVASADSVARQKAPKGARI